MNDDPETALARSFRESLLSAEAEAPSFEDVAAYVDGRLDGDARVAFEERLREDPLLQAEVADLEALRREMAQPRRAAATLPSWTYLAAAAVLVAAVAGFLSTRPPRATSSATRAATPPTAAGEPAVVASLRDGAGSLELRADGTLRGPRVPEGLAPSVVRALRDGAVAVPALRADLAVAPVTAMGGGSVAAARFAPAGPLSTLVRSDRPTLRWSPHPRARSYQVSVFDLDLEPVAASGAITATEWTPGTALRRGQTYLWQVQATTAAGSETVPSPPAPEARFHVASASAVATVEPAIASGSALAAGVALAEAGFLEEAAQRFDALGRGQPGVPGRAAPARGRRGRSEALALQPAGFAAGGRSSPTSRRTSFVRTSAGGAARRIALGSDAGAPSSHRASASPVTGSLRMRSPAAPTKSRRGPVCWSAASRDGAPSTGSDSTCSAWPDHTRSRNGR